MSRYFPHEVLTRSRALISTVILTVLALLAPMAVVSAPLVSVFVNGMRVEAYPTVKDGVAYLPIQVMAQAMESEIVWDAKLGCVKVNGVPSSATVYNHNGKVMLPIESFITGIGGTVVFDGRRNMIRVETAEYIANGPSRTSTYTPDPGTATALSTGAVATGVTTAGTATAPAMGAVAAGVTAIGTAATAVNRNSPAVTSGHNEFAAGSLSTSRQPAPYQTAPAQTAPKASYGGNAPSFGVPAVATAQTSAPSQPVTAYSAPSSNNAGWNGGQTAMRTAPVSGNAPGIGVARPATASQGASSLFIPRTSQNGVFKVTVSNLEVLPVIKDYYKPHAGSKFVVVSLSQQNISNQVQIYTGKFSLVDQNQNSYDHLEGLSNFWLVILRPFGVNFGYLVFEIPQNAKPSNLVLHALNQAPLTINL